jgi:hypothetical protein
LESAESQGGLTALIAMPDDASALTVGVAAGDGDRSVGHPLGAAEPADAAHEARASGDRVVVAA